MADMFANAMVELLVPHTAQPRSSSNMALDRSYTRNFRPSACATLLATCVLAHPWICFYSPFFVALESFEITAVPTLVE